MIIHLRHPIPADPVPPDWTVLPPSASPASPRQRVARTLRHSSTRPAGPGEVGPVANLLGHTSFWTDVVHAAQEAHEDPAPTVHQSLIVETYDDGPRMVTVRLEQLTVMGAPVSVIGSALSQSNPGIHDPDGFPINTTGRTITVTLGQSLLSIPHENIAGIISDTDRLPEQEPFRPFISAQWPV